MHGDDVTMVIPASNSTSIPAELENVEAWSRKNNQSLNLAKTTELMVSLDRHLLFTHHVTQAL